MKRRLYHIKAAICLRLNRFYPYHLDSWEYYELEGRGGNSFGGGYWYYTYGVGYGLRNWWLFEEEDEEGGLY